MTLFLIGMPGAGKTTFGKALAAALNFPFTDLDAAVETQTGMTISALFQTGGEGAFREAESAALRGLDPAEERVAATGGGIILRPENVALLRRGRVIYIDRPLERIRGDIDRAARPLLKTPGALEALWRERAHLYGAAAHARVGNDGEKDVVLAALEAAARALLGKGDSA
ncbi:shikimate kinase [Oscillospiraceae bacterium OttesenSCG-928-F05]|nr:shikimate kinase [Oscillospiraceae bacterium OttesenSCG-928-F05]